MAGERLRVTVAGRDAADLVPIEAQTFVSARVGCIVLNPLLDLTAVCLK